MATSRERRIVKELADIAADRDKSGVYAEPVDAADLTRLRGYVPAPPDTVYAGGTFAVDIQIPEGYPFKPPIVKFHTKIFHPNISSQTVGVPPPPFSSPCSFTPLPKQKVRGKRKKEVCVCG